MNIKAERIDQLIQIINRNLMLVYSGQYDGLAEVDTKRLQRVDAVIFGHDKFAYEMVHFVRSASEKLTDDDSLFSKWESTFVRGLESLLVECSVIHDDVERDCFVSRVYCWFTEKLLERREVPRDDHVDISELRSSVTKLAGDNSYSRLGLDNFQRSDNHREVLLPANDTNTNNLQQTNNENQGVNDVILPNIEDTNRSRATSSETKKIQRLPVYVKHNYPSLFKNKEMAEYDSFLPKVNNSGSSHDNYGLLYNKPETEAEKKMNELWLARRRQEAFEFKTQQQLALVMDRMALHKARMESDALRRQESSSMLKVLSVVRPKSASAAIKTSSTVASMSDQNVLQSTSPQPVKPTNEMKSSSNEHAQFRSIAEKMNNTLYESMRTERSRSPSPRRMQRTRTQDGSIERNNNNAKISDATTSIVMTGNGYERETKIARANRTIVTKQEKQKETNSKPLPMKFKMELPDGYSNERNQYYMQLSDSEDEEIEEKGSLAITGTRSHRQTINGNTMTNTLNASNTGAPPTSAPTANAAEPKKKKSGGNKAEVPMFKHDPPVVRERPISAKIFHQISANDPEFKVHYRHTNYRRMPLTEEQQQWIEERHSERTKKSEEVAKALVAAQQAKNDKKKGKDSKGKGKEKESTGKKGGKSGNSGSAAKSATSAVNNATTQVPSKYKSAQHFMDVHFPQFEADDNLATMGPMRALQMMEVANVLEACDKYRVPVKESAVRRALVIPQDRPEAICLENLREEKEGLLVNPNPPEYWRKFSSGGKGGKKKKKK